MSEYEDDIEVIRLDEHLDEVLPDEEDILSDMTPSSPPSPPSNEETINQLTLQLLLNANSYKKYMAKVNSEKKEVKSPIEDLELYIGNIEKYISDSLEKVLHTGELRTEHIDPMYEIHDSFRTFLSKSIEYYRNLANIKVKKIDKEEKNYDQMGTVEKEHLTFLKVKKTEEEQDSLNDILNVGGGGGGNSSHYSQTPEFDKLLVSSPPVLKRHTAKTFRTNNYSYGYSYFNENELSL